MSPGLRDTQAGAKSWRTGRHSSREELKVRAFSSGCIVEVAEAKPACVDSVKMVYYSMFVIN